MFKNNKYSKNPIIVSGMPRTATTIVGKLISQKAPYNVLYEPFNSSQGLKSIDINYLIPGSNIMENDFDGILASLLDLNGSFKLGIKKNDSLFKKMIKYTFGNQSSISFKKAKYLNPERELIIKDPFLIFASKYLSKNYRVIMCERPLLPLAGSFKRMSWTFSEYSQLLKGLEHIGVDIKNPNQFNNNDISPFVVGAVQFFYLYTAFKQRILNNDKIYFFNQHDLSVNPNGSIVSLFDWLNIDCSENEINQIVTEISGSLKKNKAPKKGVQHDTLYNKRYANEYFKSVLTESEIKYVRKSELIICSGGEI